MYGGDLGDTGVGWELGSLSSCTNGWTPDLSFPACLRGGPRATFMVTCNSGFIFDSSPLGAHLLQPVCFCGGLRHRHSQVCDNPVSSSRAAVINCH